MTTPHRNSQKPLLSDIVKLTIEKFSPSLSKFIFIFAKNCLSLIPCCILGKPVDDNHGSVLYIGTSKRKADFWIDQFCGTGSRRNIIGRKWYRSIYNKKIERTVTPDFLVFETSPVNTNYLKRFKSFKIPEWIDMIIPLDIVSTQNKRFKRSKRIALENNLTLRSGHTLELLDIFYDRFYLPYAMARYSNDAFIYSKQSFLHDLEYSDFFLLESKDQIVAAMNVVYNSKEQAYMRAVGFDKEFNEMAQYQVGDAFYALILQELINRNFSEVSMGGVHPFYSNSLVRYKMNWDAQPASKIQPSSSWFHFFVRKNSQNVVNCLKENPFWYSDQNQDIYIALFGESEHDMAELQQKINHSGIKNYQRFSVNQIIDYL